MTIRVEIIARGHGRTSDAEASKVAAWRGELFAEDQDIVDAFTWQNKDGMGFGIHAYIDDEFIGFTHVFPRMGLINDSAILMGCLGSVMTSKQHQGKGVGTIAVKTAGGVILNTLQADLGVLVCKSALLPFYERLGWRRIPGPVFIEQRKEKMQWPFEAMALLREGESPAAGTLDLCGLPF